MGIMSDNMSDEQKSFFQNTASKNGKDEFYRIEKENGGNAAISFLNEYISKYNSNGKDDAEKFITDTINSKIKIRKVTFTAPDSSGIINTFWKDQFAGDTNGVRDFQNWIKFNKWVEEKLPNNESNSNASEKSTVIAAKSLIDSVMNPIDALIDTEESFIRAIKEEQKYLDIIEKDFENISKRFNVVENQVLDISKNLSDEKKSHEELKISNNETKEELSKVKVELSESTSLIKDLSNNLSSETKAHEELKKSNTS